MIPSTGPGEEGAPRLRFHEVDRNRWPDLAALFESKGGPKSCWCMIWRAQGQETKETKGWQRKAALEGRVKEGTPVGLLGYLREEPVAWCSIGPRSTYRRLGGLVVPGEEERDVWSLVCFFIKRDLRGAGMSSQLLAAALDHARSKGAKAVEAYPVDPDSPSYRFMGFVPLFQSAGFEEVGTAGSRRRVMRKQLG